MVKHNKAVQRFYDDLIYGDKATLSKSEAMLKAFPFPTIEQLPSLQVLEVGLGRGEWSLGLATYARKYTGLDYSGKTIEYVRQELESNGLHENASLEHGTVLALPFEDNYFDVAYCIGVLHATPDAVQGFRELLRVLKPGGTLNIMLYGKVQPRNIIRDTLFYISKLGRWADGLILKLVLAIEKWHLPDTWFFNADGNIVLYKDWYFAPIQSHHTIQQITEWAQQEGAEVTYAFLDPYRGTLKRHQRWASGKILGRFLCPDFMASIQKPGVPA
ncbi:MAG: class I SAM-dependent methyltransferase [Nitrospinae bacterium]|nr:class I SAM-dependent methyltransferase [Nitrospinota bacterium]